MAGCTVHAQNDHISTSGLKSDISSFSTPISYETRKFRQFGHKEGLYCIFFMRKTAVPKNLGPIKVIMCN